ncbi:FAD-dependent oxidoreductase [Saccharopolyspora aridisoli]|uniref:FAD-dependent oxidoreductase n=1 Tax=Saccharopolyspora aridisoli TaxID=2530385 RepID=A0A4R4V2E6_9PSEU|nr:FAD-dependent oxidoreductase [Saccharopolyspora aridisoli]TDC95443.1 FAD-dependent oxidoreductase [Saccharopolyspora aridisoli]
MRIIVVGAGVVGLASAYRLAKSGCEVVVVDAGAAGAAASHGNAAKIALAESAPVPAPGVILQSLRWMLKPDSPLYVRPSLAPDFVKFMLKMARHCNARDFRSGLQTHLRLAEGTMDLLDEWADDDIAFEMHRAGVLLAFETEERYREQLGALDVFERFGMVPQDLHDGDVQAFEPALSERIRHGLFFPDDRQVEPDSLTRGLAKRCRELGVQIHEHTPLHDFVRRGDSVLGVRTTTGSFRGDRVVLAAGVWTGELTKQLGVPLPIRPGKGYSVDYSPAPIQLRTSLTLEDARVAVTPLDGMIRLAGTMEFGGTDDAVSPRRVSAIKRAAAEAFPAWGGPPGEAKPWAGLRPMTPDGLPVIGRLHPLPEVFVASGHGMLGLTLAPATAELLTGAITADRFPAELEAVSPRRFTR